MRFVVHETGNTTSLTSTHHRLCLLHVVEEEGQEIIKHGCQGTCHRGCQARRENNFLYDIRLLIRCHVTSLFFDYHTTQDLFSFPTFKFGPDVGNLSGMTKLSKSSWICVVWSWHKRTSITCSLYLDCICHVQVCVYVYNLLPLPIWGLLIFLQATFIVASLSYTLMLQ